MSMLFFRWVRDSQSGMWVFRRSILEEMKLEVGRHGVLRGDQDRGAAKSASSFAEIAIIYTSRTGEIKLNPWRDGIENILFLFKKRFAIRKWQ